MCKAEGGYHRGAYLGEQRVNLGRSHKAQLRTCGGAVAPSHSRRRLFDANQVLQAVSSLQAHLAVPNTFCL